MHLPSVLSLPGARRWTAVLALGVVASASAAAGCATKTATTHVWQANAPTTRGPLQRVMVFAGGMSETERRALEDGFVERLARDGVEARPSYTMFPALPERDQARAALEAAGIDGALVTRLRGVRERQRYVPGHMTGGFWGSYYGPGWGGMYSPGYVVTDEVVLVETTLWDVRGEGNLLWSSTTQTTNPKGTRDFVGSLAKEVVPNLLEASVVRATRERE